MISYDEACKNVEAQNDFFGTMQQFQEEIGSEVSVRNEYISKEEVLRATKEIIEERGSTFNSRADFLEVFPYSLSLILNRFNSFDSFIKTAKINIVNSKKAKYTKQEVDDIILSLLKGWKSNSLIAKTIISIKPTIIFNNITLL